MAKLTPQEFREKQARRLKAAIEDMRSGVEKVTEAPTVKAAAKQEKMLNNLTEAIRSGKWGNRLKKVTLEEWKGAFVNKGLTRVASGIDGAASKVEDFAAQLLPYQDALQAKLKSMPDMTLEDSIARATTWIREMSKFQRK